MNKIAIITVNYNGKEDTLEFLDSLTKLPPTTYKLLTIVVDNASSDGSVSAIRKDFPDVDILQAGSNLGFSGGFNKGIEYAKIWGADYSLLLNNDCLINDSDLLDKLVATLKSDPKIGAVSPKIYFAPGFEFHTDKYTKEDLGKVIWFAGGDFDWDNIGNRHKGLDKVTWKQYDKVEESEIFSGACVLIKKEVFEKAGLFDEKYFLYFEDSDLAVRIKDKGFKIYYNGLTSIYHKVSRSTGLGSQITDYYLTRNRLIFAKQYASKKTKFALFREAVKLLLFGRPAQRRGVLDFYLGITEGKAEMMETPKNIEYSVKLSICIVNYNTPDLIKKLLDSIFNSSTPGVGQLETSGFDPENMEVIVLDNGDIDPCKEKIKKYLNKVKYIKNIENEGFSKGYNKTIRYSLGEYYLMLNSDIEVLEGGLSELIKVEDDFGGKAVLGGKLVFPDGSDQDSVFHLPTIKGAFKEYFLKKWGSYFMYMPKASNPVKVEGLVMACFLIPKKVLQKVGFLDERSFIFFEDIEYCRRLQKFGIPIYFVPSARFIHHHGASTKQLGFTKANELLQKSARFYHGQFYLYILNLILKIGQKLGRVQTPQTRWNNKNV